MNSKIDKLNTQKMIKLCKDYELKFVILPFFDLKPIISIYNVIECVSRLQTFS